MNAWKSRCCPLVGFTTGREFHPAPKVEYSISEIILQIAQEYYIITYKRPGADGSAPGLWVTPLCLDDGGVGDRADRLALR